jgi:hypothetical protein
MNRSPSTTRVNFVTQGVTPKDSKRLGTRGSALEAGRRAMTLARTPFWLEPLTYTDVGNADLVGNIGRPTSSPQSVLTYRPAVAAGLRVCPKGTLRPQPTTVLRFSEMRPLRAP